MARTNTTSSTKTITSKRAGLINEFLWSCAGVNKAVLRQCPADYAKYTGIGGMILFTAVMAAISGGYALNFVFHNIYIAGTFGVFWGLLIFNLDRFIVNTMYSDGKHTISWGEIRSGLPRIIMAIFLGIVISTPLELKIFEDKIKMQIEDEKESILNHRLENITNEFNQVKDEILSVKQGVGYDDATKSVHIGNIRIDALTDSIRINQPILTNIQQQINNINSKIRNLNKEDPDYQNKKISLENSRVPLQSKRAILSGTINRWKLEKDELMANLGIIIIDANEKKDTELTKLENERDSLSHMIADAKILHKGWSKEQIREMGSLCDKINLEYGGFNAQLKAFQDIREKNPSTNIAAWFVMLLFIIIETAPTFLKMMMEDGPYEDLLRAQKYKTKVLADKSISDVNDAVNTCVRISTMKNEKRLEAETIANEEIMAKIARAQAELLETAIAEWKEIELEKIRQNPYSYVVSLVPPQQEVQVTVDQEGDISEFVHNEPNEMTVVSNEVIDRAGEINPTSTPQDIIDTANAIPEEVNITNIDDSDSDTDINTERTQS